MAFTNVLPGSTSYPELLLEWAPTSQPTDATQTWVDITDRLRGWDWGYGRNDELARFDAGSGSVILDNRDRAFDPSYTAGAWFGNVKPRRKFRLRAKWSGVTYPVFEAHARGFPQSYPAAGFDALVKVDLFGTEAILQGVDLVVGFSRPAELSGDRIDAVLDAVGIPAANRAVDAGTTTVSAIDVTSEGVSGLDHARAVAADSEFGQFFAAKDGKLTFHDRHRRLHATSLYTFSDDGQTYGTDIQVAYDDTYLWNYIRVTDSADSEATAGVATDSASEDDYHPITRPVSSQLSTANERQALAEYELFLYSQPAERLPSIPFQGAANPSVLWPMLLDLEVSDRVTWERFFASVEPKSLLQNVEGIRHACSPGGPWLSSVAVSPADDNQYWLLGSVGFSELGTTTNPAP